jgi:dATP pyrophosphohydrolase
MKASIPHLCVAYWGTEGAGILAIAEDTGRFLVGLRSENVREPGTWNLPGGKRDKNDKTLEDTALREFKEETGYDGPLDLVPVMEFEDPGVFVFKTFVGLLPTEVDLDVNHETDEFRWVSFAELIDLEPKHPGFEILLDVAKDALEEYISIEEETD